MCECIMLLTVYNLHSIFTSFTQSLPYTPTFHTHSPTPILPPSTLIYNTPHTHLYTPPSTLPTHPIHLHLPILTATPTFHTLPTPPPSTLIYNTPHTHHYTHLPHTPPFTLIYHTQYSPLHPHLLHPSPHSPTHQAIIYKLIKFPRLSALLNNEQIQTALESRRSSDYKDVDVLFDNEATIIEDYRDNGILKRLFINVFHPFIEYCVQQQRGLEVGGVGAWLYHCMWVGLDHCFSSRVDCRWGKGGARPKLVYKGWAKIGARGAGLGQNWCRKGGAGPKWVLFTGIVF